LANFNFFMLYSIIIPVYNEEKRINKNIDEIFDFFYKQKVETEIIFVNDGSIDRTEDILREYQKKYKFKIISYKKNRGKGYAVKQGILSSKGDWAVFFDIDLATPLEEFNHFLSIKKQDVDHIIIGSRRLKESNIKKSESGIRVFLGSAFTKISNLLVPNVTDFTCGFKCFSKEAKQIIFPLAKIDRWGFDTELLYIAKLKNISIRQMAVKWRHDDDSRVNVIKAVFSSLHEIFQMKINQMKGFYK